MQSRANALFITDNRKTTQTFQNANLFNLYVTQTINFPRNEQEICFNLNSAKTESLEITSLTHANVGKDILNKFY